MTRPYCVGLTGGIGSGKTSATDIFSELGVPVIDADDISHEVVQAGQPGLQAITDAFGPEVLNEEGQLRRAQLRKLVFDDPLARQKLESIVHPLVYDEITRRVNQVTYSYCIISSPLLLESKSNYSVDRVLVIDVPEGLQIERATLRDNVQESDIKKIISSQSKRQHRLNSADDVITNDKDITFLKEQIETLHNKYLKTADINLAPCS